jgi:hypothetical protein
MTKIQINYSNTIIYKIVCNDLLITDVYIGSTTNFRVRKNHHKSVCNNAKNKEYNQKKYITIRANGGWENWSIIEIEKYPCCDNNEARARERYWYELINANMNTIKPFITEDEKLKYKKEYKELNEFVINKKHKEYYKLNIENFKEKTKCLCDGCYTYASKQRHFRTKKHQCYLAQIKETII